MSEEEAPLLPGERERWTQARAHYMELASRNRHQTVFWQGKFNTVRHENNKLRRRMARAEYAIMVFGKMLTEADTAEKVFEIRERFAQWRSEHGLTLENQSKASSGPVESGPP